MSNAILPGNSNVLLIEDNPGDARLIRELLAEGGARRFRLEHADRLASGLACLERGGIVAVLLDLSLPDSHGLETLSRVHAYAPRVPVLVLTGLDDEALTHTAMQQGAQDYLVKGQIDGELLVRAIRYAVDRNRAQLAMRESEASFRRMFEGNPLPMWVYDAETLHFLEVNEAAVRHYGYSREEFRAMRVGEVVALEDRAAFLASLASEPPDVQRTNSWRHRQSNGQAIDVETVSYALMFADRQAALVVAQDITERKRTEEALRAKQAAEEANRAKSAFLSRMSHELRTPLNAILGFTQLLQLDKLSRDQHDSLDQVTLAGHHLLNLINEVLEISRIEAGHISLSMEPVFVSEVIDESMALIKPLAEERQVELRRRSGGMWDEHILADRQRLKQILLNLLTNAVKYNRPGGTVTVTCEPSTMRARLTDAPEAHTGAPDEQIAAYATRDALRIVVSDTGEGIAADKLSRLFTPFDRLDAENYSAEGTGLGLALSKGLAEAMRGSIGVQSEVGQGTSFWLELPVTARPDAMLDDTLEPLALPPMPRQSRTILLIEDNLSNLKLLDRLLRRWPNIELIPAMQGTLGLQLAEQHHPDLILLDLHLPDLHGSEVLRRLQAWPQTSDIPVIVVSADATPQQIAKILAAGARSYLTKPLDVARFIQVVGEALN